MISADSAVCQSTHRRVRQDLRAVLLDVLAAGPGTAGGVDSVTYRAVAALYTLLLEHPVDRRGRCSSCRPPGAVLGRRRRRCHVYRVARYWWCQPGTTLASSLVSELGLIIAPTPVARPEPGWPGLTITGRPTPDRPHHPSTLHGPDALHGPDPLGDTDVLPRVEPELTAIPCHATVFSSPWFTPVLADLVTEADVRWSA